MSNREESREKTQRSDRSNNNANLSNFSWVWRISWVCWLKSIGFDRNTDHTLIRNIQQRGVFSFVFFFSSVLILRFCWLLYSIFWFNFSFASSSLRVYTCGSRDVDIEKWALYERARERRKTIKTWESSLQRFFSCLVCCSILFLCHFLQSAWIKLILYTWQLLWLLLFFFSLFCVVFVANFMRWTFFISFLHGFVQSNAVLLLVRAVKPSAEKKRHF